MRPRTTFLLSAAVAACLGVYVWTEVEQSQQQIPPRLSVDESEALQVAATGRWRSLPDALNNSDKAEGATPTEIVTLPPERSQIVRVTPASSSGSIALHLQRELARVGCYSGEINGVWTNSTRDAMKVFMDRVNAALPTNQPDDILLVLVRGHAGKVCGAECPSGQGLTRDGRCIPTAMFSGDGRNLPKQSTAANSVWSATTIMTSERSSALEIGQMALAGPKTGTPAGTPKVVSAPRTGSREARGSSGRDWKAELWNQH
jgi:hypothetical protein